MMIDSESFLTRDTALQLPGSSETLLYLKGLLWQIMGLNADPRENVSPVDEIEANLGIVSREIIPGKRTVAELPLGSSKVSTFMISRDCLSDEEAKLIQQTRHSYERWGGTDAAHREIQWGKDDENPKTTFLISVIRDKEGRSLSPWRSPVDILRAEDSEELTVVTSRMTRHNILNDTLPGEVDYWRVRMRDGTEYSLKNVLRAHHRNGELGNGDFSVFSRIAKKGRSEVNSGIPFALGSLMYALSMISNSERASEAILGIIRAELHLDQFPVEVMSQKFNPGFKRMLDYLKHLNPQIQSMFLDRENPEVQDLQNEFAPYWYDTDTLRSFLLELVNSGRINIENLLPSIEMIEAEAIKTQGLNTDPSIQNIRLWKAAEVINYVTQDPRRVRFLMPVLHFLPTITVETKPSEENRKDLRRAEVSKALQYLIRYSMDPQTKRYKVADGPLAIKIDARNWTNDLVSYLVAAQGVYSLKPYESKFK